MDLNLVVPVHEGKPEPEFLAGVTIIINIIIIIIIIININIIIIIIIINITIMSYLLMKVNLSSHSWQVSLAVSGTQIGLIRPRVISLLIGRE